MIARKATCYGIAFVVVTLVTIINIGEEFFKAHTHVVDRNHDRVKEKPLIQQQHEVEEIMASPRDLAASKNNREQEQLIIHHTTTDRDETLPSPRKNFETHASSNVTISKRPLHESGRLEVDAVRNHSHVVVVVDQNDTRSTQKLLVPMKQNGSGAEPFNNTNNVTKQPSANPARSEHHGTLERESVNVTKPARIRSTTLEDVVREATRLLYKDSPNLEKWLAAPLPKVYIYNNTLPKELSDVATISQCVNDNFLNVVTTEDGKNNMTTRMNWTNCLWEPGICDDVENPAHKRLEQRFMNYKVNYNNDVAYLQWFQGYTSLTTDPMEADIFLVPYPHWSHCLCNRDLGNPSSRCPVGVDAIRSKVLSKLKYYKKYTDRHLFLYSADWGLVNRKVKLALAKSMSISLGPADGCIGRTDELCGHMVTPYLSSGAAYQPRALLDDRWQSNDREFSIGAVFGTPGNFHLRIQLLQNTSALVGDAIGGLPIKLVDLGRRRRQLTSKEITNVYRSSVFCPVLPGDGCPQKRFFDVILSGCIPVVPRFTPSDEEGYPTFFRWQNMCSIRRTYPFARGSFFDDRAAGIDYESLVVSFDGPCGITCMKPAIEQAMKNATEMKRLRENMKTYAKLFAFGLDGNMYKSMDAFSAMLVTMRHYIFHLRGKYEQLREAPPDNSKKVMARISVGSDNPGVSVNLKQSSGVHNEWT